MPSFLSFAKSTPNAHNFKRNVYIPKSFSNEENSENTVLLQVIKSEKQVEKENFFPSPCPPPTGDGQGDNMRIPANQGKLKSKQYWHFVLLPPVCLSHLLLLFLSSFHTKCTFTSSLLHQTHLQQSPNLILFFLFTIASIFLATNTPLVGKTQVESGFQLYLIPTHSCSAEQAMHLTLGCEEGAQLCLLTQTGVFL